PPGAGGRRRRAAPRLSAGSAAHAQRGGGRVRVLGARPPAVPGGAGDRFALPLPRRNLAVPGSGRRRGRGRHPMKHGALAGIVSLSLLAGGCAGMTQTEQRTLSGGAGGAAAGAAIGAIAGDTGLGAAIGGAAGVVGGYLYGKHKEAEERAYREGYEAGSQR